MRAVTHLEKVITGEVSAVTHLEKVIAEETSAVTYTEKVIAGEATPITHLQKVIAGVASPVTHLEQVWAGGSPTPSEHEYTGAVPVTITANGQPLIDYTIYGNTVQNGTPTQQNPIMPQGTGERTGNLFNPYTVANNYYVSDTDGELRSASNNVSSDYIEVEGNTDYYITTIPSGNWGAWYDEDKTYISGITGYNIRKSPANAKYVRLTVSRNNNPDYATNFMIAKSSVSIPYEPYGYKIPISSAGQTNNIYIGSEPLRKAVDGSEAVDTLNYSTQQLIRRVDSSGNALAEAVTVTLEVPEIPTVEGQNTIDVETAVKPSEVYIKYKG